MPTRLALMFSTCSELCPYRYMLNREILQQVGSDLNEVFHCAATPFVMESCFIRRLFFLLRYATWVFLGRIMSLLLVEAAAFLVLSLASPSLCRSRLGLWGQP